MKIRNLFILKKYNEVLVTCEKLIKENPARSTIYIIFTGVSCQALKKF